LKRTAAINHVKKKRQKTENSRSSLSAVPSFERGEVQAISGFE
jgi:hypothetical protein